jgi:hypothetical protein
MASWPSRDGSARDTPLLHKTIDNAMVAPKVMPRKRAIPVLSMLFVAGMAYF